MQRHFRPSAALGAALVLALATPGASGQVRPQDAFSRPATKPPAGSTAKPAPGPIPRPAPGGDPVPRSGAKTVTLERIVAVVNDEVITAFDLAESKRLILQQLRGRGTPPPPDDVLERQILERMITDRTLLQFARENGIRVEDVQVERTIQRIADQNRMSVADLRRALEREGLPYERYREDIRSELVVSRLREREVEQRIVVTDSEVDTFLALNPNAAGQEDEYRLAHILVAIPEQARPEQIQARRARAEEAERELRRGASFAQVAAAFSDAPDALQGGDLGWRSAARLPSVFAETVRAMKVGDTSGILRSASGFHIVRVVEQRGKDTPLVVDQTRARHILVRVNEVTSEADARAKIDRVRDRLDAGASFAEQARLNSEDASASRGGDLGWISPGDTVPEFEQAMQKLAIDEISAAVRTPFGWHLIQVAERRRQDVTVERARERARQAIRERKAEEAYGDWVRQVRDRAYVELRLDDR
jgi:peptidyl-prolyl cis-trans isomerase SurA